MMRRLLYISLLALGLLAPAGASAATQSFGTVDPHGDSGSPGAALHKAQSALVAGGGVNGGAEVTPLLKELALKLPGLKGAERRRALRLLARPTQGEGGSNELEYETSEEKPICSDHYCIHWVDTTDDAPSLADSDHNGVPDYVQAMDAVFEHVYAVENVELGWRPPTSDGMRGCHKNAPDNCPNRTDVYIKEIGGQGIYGYAAPDPQQRSYSQAAYLVMDNDYNASQFPRYEGDPLPPMEVTAAHEYNHVLQFGYDTAQDTWMFESTAVWMEDRVYTDVNDYLQYLTPWSQMTFVPLTYFSSDGNDPLNVKVYGDGVWNRWIEQRYDADTIRDAWASSRKTTPKSFGPGAYDASLKTKGTSFYEAFSTFASDTAEWRDSNTPFAEGVTFPDVDRAASDSTGRPITLTPDGVGASGKLSHTAYILLDVRPPENAPQLRLAVSTPRGTRMAIALVGRIGDDVNGTSQEFLKLLPKGGPGTVAIANPGQYDRLTAVVVNADASANRFSRILQDWVWEKDEQPINARVSEDFAAPSVARRSPKPRARGASTRTRVAVTFTDRMFELTSRSVRLVAPNGRSVKAKLQLTTRGKKSRSSAGADKVVLAPRARLRTGTRYEVRLSRDLRDFGGNALPSSRLRWSFVTKR
jgi:Bacterial Ig-like domain